MDPAIIVLTTMPQQAQALELADILIRNHLAACVNVLPPMTSLYEWKGKPESGCEHLLLIKTRRSRYADVEACVLQMHPYELPEIIYVPIESGLKAYLDWIGLQTRVEPE